MSSTLRPIFWLLLLTWLVPHAGCALIDDSHKLQTRPTNLLAPIPKSRDTIQLEIAYVDRPVDDPLLGNRLWREVDQIGAMTAEVRAALEQNGFRIGLVSSTPPPTLQTLLGLTAETGGNSSKQKRLNVLPVPLQSGSEAVVNAREGFVPNCSIAVRGVDGEQVTEFQNARFVFRVTAERLQDGWVRLDLLPEIHHDSMRLRPTATETGFQLSSAQKVEPLYDQRFQVELNVGEMVVLTADRSDAASAGYHFFLGADPEARTQRVLVVRLADMRKIDPVFAE